MNEFENTQCPVQQDERASSPFELKYMPGLFVGMTIGNVIGDHLFDMEFSDASAVPRAAIATGLLYGGHKVWDKIKS